MASILALSLLCFLPSAPSAAAWTPPAPIATRNRARTRSAAVIVFSRPIVPIHHRLSASTLSQGTISREALENLTVPELKERLRSSGRKVTGKKADLIKRLVSEQLKEIDDESNVVEDRNGRDPSVEQLPQPLIEALTRFSSSESTSSTATSPPKLLPIQQQSYQIIADGQDAVLFSPTGTGKTLAFVLPLAARLWGWKHDGSLKHQKAAQKERFMRQRNRRDGNDSMSSQAKADTAMPSILIVEPSRELARQVGKVWAKFHPTATRNNKRQVVTVYGGVPMERQAALLGSKTDVVIGTPGRIKELIREKYVSTSHIRSIVLDEADTLLNFKDNPEVEWLLDGMMNDYQLVLASATINKRVERFVGGVMELEVGEEGYVVAEVLDDDSDDVDDGIDVDGVSTMDGVELTDNDAPKSLESQPTVNHWSMPASAGSRVTLTSDLIVTISPRRCIIFAPSKAEVETAAQELMEQLSSANDVSIHTLHGDMVQAARSRTVMAFRGDTKKMTRILVATDVAARGLDLPAVDLVLQYGVPRLTGKDGTFDSELYIHRTGRAGRFGNTRTADAILLYDPAQGERTTLMKLEEEVMNLQRMQIMPRQLPSPSEIMEASYKRALLRCEDYGTAGQTKGSEDGQVSLVKFFSDRLMNDLDSDGSFDGALNERESFLIHQLATAMAALSGLDSIVPPRSLLTANTRDRTIRVRNKNPLSPPEVTKVVKALGSGKLGRISICEDGSAVFDLSAMKAEHLLKKVANDKQLMSSGWHFDMPSSL